MRLIRSKIALIVSKAKAKTEAYGWSVIINKITTKIPRESEIIPFNFSHRVAQNPCKAKVAAPKSEVEITKIKYGIIS